MIGQVVLLGYLGAAGLVWVGSIVYRAWDDRRGAGR